MRDLEIQITLRPPKQVEEFVYSGSDVNKEDRIKKEINRRIQSSAKFYHLIKKSTALTETVACLPLV